MVRLSDCDPCARAQAQSHRWSVFRFLGGVHIVGGERGDAFIAFHSDDDARQAMQKDGGLICQQPVKLFLSSKIEMQNVIAAARGKPPASTNPVSNSNSQGQQGNLSQQKRPDPLSQQFTHDVDENQHQAQQHQAQQQQQQTQAPTGQTNVGADPMASFLEAVNKMQQQQKSAASAVAVHSAPVPSVMPTAVQAAPPASAGLAPANLVLQLLQSNLGNLPPNVLAQVQGQLAGQGKALDDVDFGADHHVLVGLGAQPAQILQHLATLQAAAQQQQQQQQQGSPMQTNASPSTIYNPSQSNASMGHHALQQSSMHDTHSAANTNAFAQGAPPPMNLFPPGSLPPNALSALLSVQQQQQQQQQQLPFQAGNNALPANFPLPPWMQPAVNPAQAAFGLGQQQQPQQQQQQQQPQPQRPLINHHPLQDEQQMRGRPNLDFNHNMPNQFQAPFPGGNVRLGQQQPQQQRTKLREPFLRVKNLSRKYSYRDVKLLFADYKLRLEDIKMINDQAGERTGNHLSVLSL